MKTRKRLCSCQVNKFIKHDIAVTNRWHFQDYDASNLTLALIVRQLKKKRKTIKKR